MRKLFLCGRSEAGKTTLTQALKGEDVHYVKTQYVKTWDITIDTPGLQICAGAKHYRFAVIKCPGEGFKSRNLPVLREDLADLRLANGEVRRALQHITKALALALGCFSFDSDVVGLLCGADEPYNLFDPAIGGVVNRPMIGIITKIDAPNANVPMVWQWLAEAGCERIFTVDSVTGAGVDELRNYLLEPKKKLSMDDVMRNQAKGLKDWA